MEKLILITYVSLPTVSCNKNNCFLRAWWDHAPAPSTAVVASSCEMSSLWHWPKADLTPENLVPQVPPHLWHRPLTSANPVQRQSESPSTAPGLVSWLPCFVQQPNTSNAYPETVTSGFSYLLNLRVSDLYFPRERCSVMLNSNLVRQKNKVFFILALQAEPLYKQEHKCPEAKKQARSA